MEISEEVQGLIQILILSLDSALIYFHSHIFLPSPLHQHSCLDHGSQSHLLQGNEMSHSAIIYALMCTKWQLDRAARNDTDSIEEAQG